MFILPNIYFAELYSTSTLATVLNESASRTISQVPAYEVDGQDGVLDLSHRSPHFPWWAHICPIFLALRFIFGQNIDK